MGGVDGRSPQEGFEFSLGESSAQALSFGTLFVQNMQKWGFVCMPTSQSHTRMGLPCRECKSKMVANPSNTEIVLRCTMER